MASGSAGSAAWRTIVSRGTVERQRGAHRDVRHGRVARAEGLEVEPLPGVGGSAHDLHAGDPGQRVGHLRVGLGRDDVDLARLERGDGGAGILDGRHDDALDRRPVQPRVEAVGAQRDGGPRVDRLDGIRAGSHRAIRVRGDLGHAEPAVPRVGDGREELGRAILHGVHERLLRAARARHVERELHHAVRGQAHLEGEPPVGRVLVEDHGDRPAAVADLGRAGDVRERLVRGRVEVDGLLRQRTRVAARRLVHVPRRVEAGRVERAGPGGPGEQEVRRVDGLPVGPADALGDGVLDRERVARDDLRGPVARVGGDGAVRGDLGEPRVRRVHDLPVAVGATRARRRVV